MLGQLATTQPYFPPQFQLPGLITSVVNHMQKQQRYSFPKVTNIQPGLTVYVIHRGQGQHVRRLETNCYLFFYGSVLC